MNIGTLLFTRLRGHQVGTDALGNRYFQDKRPRAGQRTRRWVLYAGPPEASLVPPEWHSWLARHSTDKVPPPSMGAAEKGYAIRGDAPGVYVKQP